MVLCTKSFLLYYDEKGDDGLFSRSMLKAMLLFLPQLHQGDDLHGICPSISFTGNKDAWEALALKHFIF
ncbi:hypothetical protein AMTRI_Chr11g154330 [Amborella trichopoda]